MGDSLRSTPVTNVAYLTLNGNFGNNNNDAQLIFRPLNKDLAPVSGNYYSLATNQTTDPSLRINRWSATSANPIDYGFLYDSRFNKPPSSRTVVAGGLYNATNLLYSLDNGFLWLPSASGSALLSVCRAAAFNGSLWVAGGEGPTAGGQLLYSGDGITWNVSPNARPLLVDTSDVGTVFGVAANESLWVAGCGRPNSVLYSYDGIYWATSTTASALLVECRSVAWNGSLWVATGFGSTNIIYSYDGIVWNSSLYSGIPFDTGTSVAWNGSLWIVGGEKGAGANTLASSFDGINWTYYTSPLDIVHAVAYNGGLWIIGGEYFDGNTGATLFTSPDGTTWTPVLDSDTFLGTSYSLAWTGTVWLAGGAKGIARSSDGLNWLIANTESYFSPNGCAALAVNNVLPNAPLAPAEPPAFLMGGVNPTLAYSNDGIMWNSVQKTVNSDLSGATCQTLLWNGTLWVGGFSTTANTVAYSYDGLVWNTSHIGSTYLIGGCFALAASRTLWLAGGFNNVTSDKFMIFSTDGRLWADVSSVTPLMATGGAITAIGYNGSIWIAGTTGTNKVLYSSDGLTNWQASTSGSAIFTNACYSVAWNGQIWVGVGGRAIGYSQDGINWTAAPGTTYTDAWISVAYNGTLWVAGGIAGDSSIAYSYDGLYWLPSLSAASIFTAQCSSVAWSGSLWIAGGSGTSEVSAYSYNGITWFPSSTGMDVLPYVYSVATTRMNLLDSSASPVPVLYPRAATQPGQVVYSTGLNNLYVSSIFNVNDGSGEVQIQGDLSASTVHADIFYGSTTIITNDLSANTIQVGTLTGSNATIEDISASIINVWTDLSASTIYGNDIYGTVVTADTLYANVFNPLQISTGYLMADRITVTDISAVNLDAENLYVTGIIAPTITAETLNAGIILGTTESLPIGTLANESAITITDDRTTIKNVDLLGPVYISHEAGVGQLVLDSSGSLEYPESQIYTNATDSSSGQLILSPNPYNYGIVLTPTQTQIQNNPRIIGSGLLIDNGAIGKTGSTPNAIVIGGTRTMVQNADLSGIVYVGDGQPLGNLVIQGGRETSRSCEIYVNNTGDTYGGLLDIRPRTELSNSGRITIKDDETSIFKARIYDGSLIINNGSIGTFNEAASSSRIVMTDTSGTNIQDPLNLTGTLSVGNPSVGALRMTGSSSGTTICPTVASAGRLTIGSSVANPSGIIITDTKTTILNADFSGGLLLGNNGRIGSTISNPNAIVITDTSGTIIQNPDLSGTVYIGHGNRLNSLKITGGDVSGTIQSFNTIRPTVAISGEVLIGSSDANQNAIRITDTATTLKNVSFLGGLLLGNNGTIGSSATNPNAIVVTDTSGTIFQNRGDLSGTLLIGNPSRGLRITGGDVSGVAIPTGFATMRPSVSVSGCLVLGSSTRNPDAITITDTTTSIKNLSFSGGLLLGNNGTIGSTTDSSNATAITVTDTSGTIIQYLSPKSYKIPDFTANNGSNFTIRLPGPGVYNIWSWAGTNYIRIQGDNYITTNTLNVPGRYVLAMQTPNYTKYPEVLDPFLNIYSIYYAYMNIVTEYPLGTQNTKTVRVEPTNFYSFDIVNVTNVDVNNTNTRPVPELTGFIVTNWRVSNSLSETMYPFCASGGTFTLGSSQANPNAITITDTATTITNLNATSATITSPTITGATITESTFSGNATLSSVTSSSVTSPTNTLTLGSSGNTTAINITDTVTTISNLSPSFTNLGQLDASASLLISGPGQYFFTLAPPVQGPRYIYVKISAAGTYSFICGPTSYSIGTSYGQVYLNIQLINQVGNYVTVKTTFPDQLYPRGTGSGGFNPWELKACVFDILNARVAFNSAYSSAFLANYSFNILTPLTL